MIDVFEFKSQFPDLVEELEMVCKDAERWQWLRKQPAYPTWKAVAMASEDQRDKAMDIMRGEQTKYLGCAMFVQYAKEGKK